MDLQFKRLVPGGQISVSDHARLQSEVERLSRAVFGISNASGNFLTPDDLGGIRVRNDSDEDVPAFGCMRITGAVTIEGRQICLTVDRPNDAISDFTYLLNGPQVITAGQYGRVPTPEAFMWALYDTADGVPIAGEAWGPSNGTWKIKRGNDGFLIIGNNLTSDGIVVVQTTITDFAGGGGSDTTDNSVVCSVLNCVTGVPLSSCTMCTDGPEIWIINFGDTGDCDCGVEIFQQFALTFRTPGAPVAAGVCVWESEEFACGADTYIWVLEVTSVPTLYLLLASDWPSSNPSTDALLSYVNRNDTYPFCCLCDNELEMFCPPYTPPICSRGPSTVCVQPGEQIISPSCLSLCCPDGTAEYFRFDIAGMGAIDSILYPECLLWNGTWIMQFDYTTCRWQFIEYPYTNNVIMGQLSVYPTDPNGCPTGLWLFTSNGASSAYYQLSGTFDCNGSNTFLYDATLNTSPNAYACTSWPASITVSPV